MKKKALYALPVILGFCFCFYYLTLSTDNVAYSDYIRLINSYLPDVGNPAKFFVPDILTRVPVTYLGRFINVTWFGYNTKFDLMLGLISFTLGAAVLAAYARSRTCAKPAGGQEPDGACPQAEAPRQVRSRPWFFWYLLVLAVYFGLNKWEMLTNGTGWVCLLSISGFYYHYLVLDRAVAGGHRSRKDRRILFFLPSALTLLVAGPYCGAYCAILILVYTVMLIADYRKNHRVNRLFAGYLAAVIVPLALYLWSNSYAVYVHRGAVEGSILAALIENPVFFVKFMLRALASAVLGVEQMNDLIAAGGWFDRLRAVYLLGGFMVFLYLYALYLTWRHRIWEKTVFPLLLILNGGLNHLLILSARWIFLKPDYGMSSRYEIQYQVGLIGILLTFAVCACMKGREEQPAGAEHQTVTAPAPGEGRVARRHIPVEKPLLALCAAAVLAGSLYTTRLELLKAPYRKEYLETSRSLGLNYRTVPDEELEQYLHHDADEIRRAMRILEENRLNMFRK